MIHLIVAVNAAMEEPGKRGKKLCQKPHGDGFYKCAYSRASESLVLGVPKSLVFDLVYRKYKDAALPFWKGTM